MDVNTPHLAFPLRLDGSRFAVNEQDSDEEVLDCVKVILHFPLEYREELPTFGVPDETFREGGINAAAMREMIERWEPRVRAQVNPGQIEELIQKVRVEVRRNG